MSGTSTTSRMNRAATPYKVVVMKSLMTTPETFRHESAVEAVATGVEYMCRGYWVRLSDDTLAAFEAGHHLMRLRDKITQAARGGHV